MAGLGYALVILALIISVYATVVYFLEGSGKVFPAFLRPRNALFAAAGLITMMVFILLYAILTHDFSFEYVASYTSLNTPPLYLIAALWTGNSGSLLFWTWILSIIAVLVVLRKNKKYPRLLPYAAAVMMATQTFFLILLAVGNHPFGTLSAAPADGAGINPLLQNTGMIFHPPALYLGYVAFTVPFAFAIAALLSRKLKNNDWLAASRRWTILAWLALGVGNIIGAWWAYVELGWGGYWAWDPVENAGLMPWLLATALLHSSVMQRRKSKFKTWSMVLAVLVFNMVIFGTFLTRSSILSSVHTFNLTGLEPYFITFITIALVGGLALIYYRSGDLKSEPGEEAILSRDASFVFNNVLLVGMTCLVLVGTMFPLFSKVLTGSEITLSKSFFNSVNGPILIVIILLAGLCTLIGWRKLSLRQLFKDMWQPLAGAVVLGIVLGTTAVKQPIALVALVICAFVLFSILLTWIKETRTYGRTTGKNLASAGWNLGISNTQRYGAYIVHASIILIAVGVIGSSFFANQSEDTVNTGGSLTVNQYTFTYQDVNVQDTGDKIIYSADIAVNSNGKPYTTLVAQEYFQKSQQQTVTQVALHSNLIEDLYVTFIPPKTAIEGTQSDVQAWQSSGSPADIKVLVNPLVIWIWIGGVVFLLGGLVAFWPARKSKFRVTEAEIADSGAVSDTRELSLAAARKQTVIANQIDDEIENKVLSIRRNMGKVCPRCGAEHRAAARFCTRCGTSLTKGEKND